MTYAKGALSVTASLSIAIFGPGLWNTFHGISEQKATGMGAVAGGLMEALLSPALWIIALVLFGMFYATSRLRNKALSVLFFWIPSVAATGLAGLIIGLYCFLLWQARRG